MKKRSGAGCIDCIGCLGCLIGFGGGIWGSIEVGKAIVAAMPQAHAVAIVLAFGWLITYTNNHSYREVCWTMFWCKH